MVRAACWNLFEFDFLFSIIRTQSGTLGVLDKWLELLLGMCLDLIFLKKVFTTKTHQTIKRMGCLPLGSSPDPKSN